jgi:hypothetical protein
VWILDGETHFVDTWLVGEVVKTLRQDEQSACDGNEIEETRAFAITIIDLEEEDGNTQIKWILLFQAISYLLSCLIWCFQQNLKFRFKP